QQLQDDYDVQATNIILHGVPPDMYVLVNHQEADKDIWDKVKLLMKGAALSYQELSCSDISAGEDLIDALKSNDIPIYCDQESQDAVIEDTNSSAPNDLLVLSLFEQMTVHVANLDKENQTNKMSHTPVRIEAPSELSKVSLVNESLKKLKYQLASFDKVMKKRTTSDAITVDEITEVQTVFNQMEAVVDQCFDAFSSSVDECNKCLVLETELVKKKYFIKKDVYDKLVKTRSQEKDTVIRKLKDRIKSLSEKDSVEKVKKDIDEIETINVTPPFLHIAAEANLGYYFKVP
ncbi:hypothetical protein Tco_1270375, partial [Tanacetum coccineum]